MLPVWAVRCALDDPRKIPYLLVWRSSQDGLVKEAVRINRLGPSPYLPEAESIEVKRTYRSVCHLRVLKRTLPRNGGHDPPCFPARAVVHYAALCTAGKQEDRTPTVLKHRHGSAELAPVCATRPKGVRS
jgi:hypothetical protein